MNISTRVPGYRTLVTIRYKYNFRKFLGFISTEGAELMNQVIQFFVVYLRTILLFLFTHVFVLSFLEGK